MSKSSGCVLILAGIAVAAYAVYPQPQARTEIASAQIARDMAGDMAAPAAKAALDPDTPSQEPPHPAAPPAAPSAAHSSKGEPPAAHVVPKPELVPPRPVRARRPRTGVAAVRVDEAPPRVPVGESKSAAAAPLDRAALTREIQRELKRIGCYRGDVTGVWSPSVRQAMRTFTERANASLPVEEPDPVLLAMAQSHAPGVCSAACPSGQDRAAHGRCVPSALVAGTGSHGGAKAGDRAGRHRSPTASGSPPADPPNAAYRPTGRMSLAGPPVDTSQRATAAPRRQATRRSARATGSARSAQASRRQRRAAQQRPFSGYSGLPSWTVPFLLPP